MIFNYDASYFPPVPSITIQLALLDEAFRVGPLAAFVDTGADTSIIPIRYIQQLQATVYDRRPLRSHWGEYRYVKTYALDIGIGGLRLPAIEVVGDERGNEVVLGRDVLNKLVLTLDGPQRLLEIST